MKLIILLGITLLSFNSFAANNIGLSLNSPSKLETTQLNKIDFFNFHPTVKNITDKSNPVIHNYMNRLNHKTANNSSIDFFSLEEEITTPDTKNKNNKKQPKNSIIKNKKTKHEFVTLGDFNFKPREVKYKKKINTLILESLQKSYKTNAQLLQIKSKLELFEAAKNYYIPSASLSSEYKKKLKRRNIASALDEISLDLSLTMKLWSDTTNLFEDSSFQSLLSAKYTYNQLVNITYGTIQQNLLKIELARRFLDKAEQYRKRMDLLLNKMNSATSKGILKKSDRLFADISIKKFEDSILNVKSQTELFKSTINNITPDKLYNNEYGVSKKYIDLALNVPKTMFDIRYVIRNSFDFKARKSQLESNKSSALGTNETLKAELVGSLKSKESIVLKGKRQSDFFLDSDGDSYLGLRFSFTGLNYGSYKQKQSEFALIKKQVIEFDEFLYQTSDSLGVLKEQYTLLNDRIKNIDNQIELTIGVINSLIQELLVDEASSLDIFRNLSSLSDLELSKLTVQNQLVDLVIQIKILNADIPNEYIIH